MLLSQSGRPRFQYADVKIQYLYREHASEAVVGFNFMPEGRSHSIGSFYGVTAKLWLAGGADTVVPYAQSRFAIDT